MSDMTTQEMIDWATQRARLSKSLYDAAKYEAIAARLKALEEMRKRVHILAETGLAWQLQELPAADELRAILDTVREVGK